MLDSNQSRLPRMHSNEIKNLIQSTNNSCMFYTFYTAHYSIVKENQQNANTTYINNKNGYKHKYINLVITMPSTEY